MTPPDEAFPDTADRTLVEGVATVVVVDGGRVWLQPEQVSSCGSCKSAAACGVKTGHSISPAKRFMLPNSFGAQVGDRVVVGLAEDALVRASLTAYGLPLVAMLAGGVGGQMGSGSDGVAAVGAVVGLAVGWLAARSRAKRLNARGELQPRFLRHAGPGDHGEECHTD